MGLLIPGSIIGIYGLIISLFCNPDDRDAIMYFLFTIGLMPMIIAGFLSGGYASGDRVRGNYSDSKEFVDRTESSSKFFLFGIPCVLAAIAIYYINK